MKKVKYDPKIPTLDGGGRMTGGKIPKAIREELASEAAGDSEPVFTEALKKSLPKLTQKQLDAAIRKAKGKHAVEQMISNTRGYQDYLLDDRRVLRVYKYTGTVIEMPIIVD